MYMCTCVHMIGTLVKFIYSFTPFKLATHEDNYTTLQCSYKLGHIHVQGYSNDRKYLILDENSRRSTLYYIFVINMNTANHTPVIFNYTRRYCMLIIKSLIDLKKNKTITSVSTQNQYTEM